MARQPVVDDTTDAPIEKPTRARRGRRRTIRTQPRSNDASDASAPNTTAPTIPSVAEIAPDTLIGQAVTTSSPRPASRSRRKSGESLQATPGQSKTRTAKRPARRTKKTKRTLQESEETSQPETTAPATEAGEQERKPKRRSTRSRKPRETPAPAAGDRPDEGSEPKKAPKTEAQPRKDRSERRRTTTKTESSSGGRVMLINSALAGECRIAVVHENRLEEFFIERESSVSHVGNIYKGVIVNVEASIQAAFVNFGLSKHGFLHISDVQPQYFGDRNTELEGVGQKLPRRDRPPIQRCFRRGQEVIVQVIKEGLGTKGPTLSTYLSIPGRYLVMMPGMTRLGVSRKIEDEDSRRTMRNILGELELPKDMGFILRTAGEDRTKRDLQRDLKYLERLWKVVADRVRSQTAPAELYRESDLVTRTIRDVLTTDFEKVTVDDAETAERVREFLRIVMPRSSSDIVETYDSHVPIFHSYKIEPQLEAIHSRHVPLPSGGSIVIDSTEAMVAIDVNSGRARSASDEEESAYRTNLEAALEIARQLRLRDLGGLVVCDFIDMRFDRHKRDIEKSLRDELKKHKERARILRMSQFGLIEMTRQRRGPSIKRGIFSDCPHCNGSGLVKTPESMTLLVLRNIQMAVHRDDLVQVRVTVSPEVAFELQNGKRSVLHDLETETGKRIIVHGDPNLGWEQQRYQAEDTRGRSVNLYGDQR